MCIFSSALQSGRWYRVLSKKVKVQKGTGRSSSDSNQEEKIRKTLGSEVESITLH